LTGGYRGYPGWNDKTCSPGGADNVCEEDRTARPARASPGRAALRVPRMGIMRTIILACGVSVLFTAGWTAAQQSPVPPAAVGSWAPRPVMPPPASPPSSVPAFQTSAPPAYQPSSPPAYQPAAPPVAPVIYQPVPVVVDPPPAPAPNVRPVA